MKRHSWFCRLISFLSPRPCTYRRALHPRPTLEQLETRLVPVTHIWSGGGTTNHWSDPGNWGTTGAPTGNPAALDDLIFPAGAAQRSNVNDVVITGGTPTFNSINFAGSGYNLSGNAVALDSTSAFSGSVTIDPGVTTDTIALNLQLGGPPGSNQLVTVNTGGTLTVSGAISGSSGSMLSKEGVGTLILSGTNSGFTGPVNIDNGVLQVTSASALGSSAQGVTVGTSAQLQLNNVTGGAIGLPLTLNGPGVASSGALLNVAGNNTWAGPLQLNGVAGIGVEQADLASPVSQLTLIGPIANGGAAGGITKLGSQRLILQGPGSYTGPVDIQAGVLLDQNNTGLGAGVSTTTVESGTALELGNQTGGVSSGLAIYGEHLILHGSGNAAFGDTPLAILTGNGSSGPSNDPLSATDDLWAGPITLASSIPFNLPINTRLVLSGVIDDAANPSASGSDLTLTGGGDLYLSGANSYRGTTFANAGTLTVANARALGGTGSAAVQTLTFAGVSAHTTQFTLTFNGATTAPIPFNGDSSDVMNIRTALNALTTIGAADLGGSVVVRQNGNVFTVTFGGSLAGFSQPLLGAAVTTGPGTITPAIVSAGGGGTVVANGASLLLTGDITVAGEPLIVAGLGNSGASSATPQWFPVGPAPITNGQTPGNQNVGGRVTSVAVDPTNAHVVYIATGGGGAWKTTDGGQTWRPLFDAVPAGQTSTMFVESIAIDPINAQTIYAVQTQAGGSAAVRRSFDGGATWTTLQAPIDSANVPLVIDAINPQRLLVGGGSGPNLYESLDQGDTWTNLLPSLNSVTALAVAGDQGNFQADPSFPLVTDQGADTYDPDTIYAVGTNAAGKQVVELTKDHGQSWVDRPPPAIASLGSISDIVVDPRNRDTVYLTRSAFGGGQVYESTDAGQTWTEIGNANGLPNEPAWTLVLDPRTSNLYVGTDVGVYALADGSGTWQRLGAGLPSVQVHSLALSTTTNVLTAGTYGRSVYQLYLNAPLTTGSAPTAAFEALGGSPVWAGPVLLAGDPSTNQVSIAAGTQAELTILGPISDLAANGNPRLIVNSMGTVVLSGADVYGGVTEVQKGVLVVTNPLALGQSGPSANTIVDNGAALELASDLQLEPITLNGALRSTGNNTYTGTLTLGSGGVIGVDSGSTLTIGTRAGLLGTGTITDNNTNQELIKELPGTLILASANTYTGATEVMAGVLQVQNGQALGGTAHGTDVFDGAQLQIQTPTTGQPVVVSGEALTLSGTGIFGTGALLDTGGNNTWQGPITLKSNPVLLVAPSNSVAIGVTSAADTLTVDGVISDLSPGFGLTKAGAGRLTLTHANSYGGITTVSAGELRIQNGNALGNPASGTVVQSGAALELDGDPTNTGASITVSNKTLTLNGTGVGGTGARGALENVSGSNTWGQPITLGGSSTIAVDRAGDTLNLNQAIRGAGFGVTMIGPGTLNLNGQTDSIGALVVTDGQVTTGRGGQLTVTGLTMTGGSVSLPALTSQLILGGNVTATSDASGPAIISGAGQVSLNGATRTITLTHGSNAVDLDVSAAIAGTVAIDGLVVTGAGLLELDAVNTYTGTTQIDSGVTVQADGSIAGVKLNGGTVSGKGIIGGISGSTGDVSPGDAAAPIGVLTSAGGTLGSGTTFVVDVTHTGDATRPIRGVAGTDNDELVTTGSLNLNGAILTVNVGAGIQVGDSFTILQTPGNQLAGTFSNHIPGNANKFVFGGMEFSVTYNDPSGTVTLQRIPIDTSVAVVSSINPSVYGQPVSYTAMVTPIVGTVPLSTTVTFTLDGQSYAATSESIVGNCLGATFDPPRATGAVLSVGPHTLSVTYNGNTFFAPSSASLSPNAMVFQASTTMTVAASPPSPLYGQDVTLTATITPLAPSGDPLAARPGGTATFTIDSNTEKVNVMNGVAQLVLPAPTVGLHQVNVVYNGDTNFAGSAGNLSQSVKPASALISIQGVHVPYDGNPHPAVGTASGIEQPKPLTLTSALHLFYSSDGGHTFRSSAPVNAGTFEVYYTFDGSTNYQAIPNQTDSGQAVVITGISPTLGAAAGPVVVLGTGVPLTASATLAGSVKAGGSITFTLYAPNNTVAFTDQVAVNGNGVYSSTMPGVMTGSPLPSQPGTYQWVAAYSGDGNNQSVSTTRGSTPESAVGPGATVTGTSLYLVGGNTNDQVHIKPLGVSLTGATGIQIDANLNHLDLDHLQYCQAFTTIYIIGLNGNDNINMDPHLTIATVVTMGNGNDNLQLGNGTNTVVVGNGNDHIMAGNGTNTITVGNGNDDIEVSDGTNVVVEGNGNDHVEAGNGNNLIVGGLGRHHLEAGNGKNILIDGSVQLAHSNDSLAAVLQEWVQYGKDPTHVADIRARLLVTYDRTADNTLHAGCGLDWFWAAHAQDHLNRKPGDLLN